MLNRASDSFTLSGMARRKVVVDPRDAKVIDQCQRLISEHAGAKVGKTGKLALCGCDLCRQAQVRLDKMRAKRGRPR